MNVQEQPLSTPARLGRPWHQQRGVLERFITDLVVDEATHLRPGAAPLPAGPWAPDTSLGEGGLGLDSLERMSVAAALSESLHLHESGADDLLLVQSTFGDWVRIAANALGQFDACLTFRTSGSSGQPKPCTHTLDDLQQEIRFLAGLFSGDHREPLRRVLAAVPAHHIYGFLFSVLLPAELGQLPVEDVRRETVNHLPRRMAPGDLVVSHPAHWLLLARHASALPAGVVGVTSTAPCPDDTARALASRGLQRLVQVYGSSETAGIAWRDHPASPYELMAHWTRADEPAHTLLRQSKHAPPRPFLLQDAPQWHSERQFSVQGRLDQAVQVGGINVFPSRVREVLLQHPDVADAAVRLATLQDSARLKAFVVPRPDADTADLTQRLDTWLASRLSAAERPRAFALGTELPRNAQGKLADWA